MKIKKQIIILFAVMLIILTGFSAEAEDCCSYPDCRSLGASCDAYDQCCPAYASDHGTFYGYCGLSSGKCEIADGIDSHMNELQWCKTYILDENGNHPQLYGEPYIDYYYYIYNGQDFLSGKTIYETTYGLDEDKIIQYAQELGVHPCDLLFPGWEADEQASAHSAATYDYMNNQIMVFSESKKIETNFYDTHKSGSQYASSSIFSGISKTSVDSEGNVLQGKDANGNIGRNYYDDLERPTRTEYFKPTDLQNPDFFVENFYDSYQGGGSCLKQGEPGTSFNLLCEIRDSSGKTKFRYDQRGRVVWKQITIYDDDPEIGDQVFELSFDYDFANNLKLLTLPSGEQIRYNYDLLGQLEGVEYGEYGSFQKVADFAYNPTGTISKKTLDPQGQNKITADYTYTARDFVKTMNFFQQATQQNIFQRAFKYDDAGNVRNIGYSLDPDDQDELFSYDNFYRLKSADYAEAGAVAPKNFDYTYKNILGDRETLQESGAGTTSYQYDSFNERLASLLQGDQSTYFLYDSNGNIVRINYPYGVKDMFYYDSLNRMYESTVSGLTVEYAYDYTNQRIKKKNPLETTFYVYQNNNVVFEKSYTKSFETYLCGDTNHDNIINILDVLYLVNYKFKQGPEPIPLYAGNVNGDDNLNIIDIIYLVNYKFKQGAAPVTEGDGTCYPVVLTKEGTYSEDGSTKSVALAKTMETDSNKILSADSKTSSKLQQDSLSVVQPEEDAYSQIDTLEEVMEYLKDAQQNPVPETKNS